MLSPDNTLNASFLVTSGPSHLGSLIETANAQIGGNCVGYVSRVRRGHLTRERNNVLQSIKSGQTFAALMLDDFGVIDRRELCVLKAYHVLFFNRQHVLIGQYR